jgi:hypothetical protein
MISHTGHVMGANETTLTEPNLAKLNGTAMKRIVFDHDGPQGRDANACLRTDAVLSQPTCRVISGRQEKNRQ